MHFHLLQPQREKAENLQRRHFVSGALAVTTGTAALVTAWAAMRYKVAGPNEYLVKTGIFIDDIYISKKTFWFPYQTLNKICMEPVTYHCVIEEAMSHERIAFNMPTVFTIGPKDEKENLIRFSKLFQMTTPEDLKIKVLGIIQGETRVLAGKITLDDLFNNHQHFKETLVTEINHELERFGIEVFNANIEELKDLAGNETKGIRRCNSHCQSCCC
jgi:flotillin